MSTILRKLGDVSSWALVLCALLTTVMVVHRHLTQDSPAEIASEPAATYVDEWQSALSIGMQSGPADAPVQVVEFADFECPFCARFETTVRAVREKYPSEVSFTLVHFPLPGHRFAEPAARAAECASSQGFHEAMRSVLFERHREFGLVSWGNFAEQVGISDIRQFDACINDTRPVDRIERGKELADRMHIKGTPTIIVNGWQLPKAPSLEDFDRIVKNVLAGRPPTADMDS